jgi:hypothetical protein
MTQKLEGRYGTFTAGAAMAPDLRVKLVSGVLQLAGVQDLEIGTLANRALASGDPVTVDLRTGEGTALMVASGAISADAKVYAGASGKVAASGPIFLGTALTAAAADGDSIEVLRGGETLQHTQSVTPNSTEVAGNTILAATEFVDVGAVTTDANDFIVLPPIADVVIGTTIRIACNAGGNFELRTPAASNTKINDVDADGSQEYLCTDTDLVIVTKRTTTGWVAQSLTKLGAVRTAVVPD